MVIRKQWKRPEKHWEGKKTIQRRETETYRYYISSLSEETGLFSRAVRGHLAVESMHWHPDVTFKEDANTAPDRTAAQNQNIIRKWCLSMLKLLEIRRKKMSL